MKTTKKKPTSTTKKATKKAATKKAASKATKKATKKKTAAKQTARKTTAKKTTAKKAVSKKATKKKPLVVAPDDKSFWVTDGQVLNSLLALRDALTEMEKEVYAYHVSKEHNDFANWVDVVLCDKQCARDLTKATTPTKAKTIVVKHLKVYSL